MGFGLVDSPDRDLVLTSIASDELAYELEGLKVGRRYKVQVQAYNNDGDGEIESAVWQQEDVPLQLSKYLHQGILGSGVTSYRPGGRRKYSLGNSLHYIHCYI